MLSNIPEFNLVYGSRPLEPLIYLNVEKSLAFLMTFPNALDELNAVYDKYHDYKQIIACHLCGTGNAQVGIDFMNGKGFVEFFDNVSFNGVESVPYIVRAIHLRKVGERIRSMAVYAFALGFDAGETTAGDKIEMLMYIIDEAISLLDKQSAKTIEKLLQEYNNDFDN